MSFRVEMTRRAIEDLDRLMTALEERSSSAAADRLSARFHEALGTLETRPFSRGLAYENPFFSEDVRHLLFGIWKNRPYRALFIVPGDVVKVLCIRAPGERPVGPRTSMSESRGERALDGPGTEYFERFGVYRL